MHKKDQSRKYANTTDITLLIFSTYVKQYIGLMDVVKANKDT
jgi:hypothetical protein